MKRCCETEAKKNVKKHRDVATCDACGRLVLGYTNEAEFKKTQAELEKNGVAFETGKVGVILIVAKDRNTSPPADDEMDDEDEDEEDDEG
jgi:hypothetical protein